MSDRDAVARRPISCNAVSYTGTASAVVPAPTNATAVFVWTTTDAVVKIASDSAVATLTNGIRLPAGTAVFLSCNPGDNLSAIRVTTDGTLSYSWTT